jgi:hypothetical protein
MYRSECPNKKTLRVDLTRNIAEPTRSTVQLATQRADSTSVRGKKPKAKHDPGTCAVDLKFMCIIMCLK